MKRLIYGGPVLALLLALPVLANDAAPGEVRKVEVFPAKDQVRVEITLSSAVTPAVETVRHPDRLVLRLPGTASKAGQQRVAIGTLGVRSLRYGLNQSDPPETRFVVDLDQEHSYKLSTAGSKVVLIIEAPLNSATQKRAAPAAAATAPLITALGSRSGSAPGQAGSPSSVGLPAEADSDRGSPQESTASRNEGSSAAETVPPVSALPPPTDSDGKDSQSSARADVFSGSAQSALPQESKPDTNASPESAASVREDRHSLPPSSGQNAAANPPAASAVTVEAARTPAAAAGAGRITPAPTENAAQSTEGSGNGQVGQIPAHSRENPDFRTAFRVKYVAHDAAYLDGGRASGLAEGMKLVIRDLPNPSAASVAGTDFSAAGDIAELEVLSVAETSAVTEIHNPTRPVKVGDVAYLSFADQQALVAKNTLSATRKYPVVVSFSENDTLDEEARAEVPKPPSPAVNRARGRIGFDYIGIADHSGSGMHGSDLGMVVQADITRLNGSYWNVSGYWRGRFDSASVGPQTLQDTINRTYHLYTWYDNPNSAWVAGFGRLYLPWATSLETLDGGYFGRKLGTGITSGVFFGSTPDPTSYGFNPDGKLGGAFINFQGGSYDDFRYTSTTGGGVDLFKWSVNRPFVFFENSLFYKRVFSVYQAAQIDNQYGYSYISAAQNNATVSQPGTGWGLGRSFTTVRFQPHPRVELTFNHTYFRDLPTFDLTLISTGLLDKYLFQGFSVGGRVEVHKQIWLSSEIGLSNRSGDKTNSGNQMFGVTFGRLPWWGLHADLRYTRFNSAFGSGSYKSLSLSRNLGDTFQLQVLAGQQNFASPLTSTNQSRFVNAMVETALGAHYFWQGGATISRGGVMNYDQWLFTFGYRFDNRHGHKGQ